MRYNSHYLICHWCRWYRWQFNTCVIDTGGKFATSIVDTGGYLLPVSTTPAVPVKKFAAGDIDTGATGVVDTGGAPSLHLYLREFLEKFEITLMLFSGA